MTTPAPTNRRLTVLLVTLTVLQALLVIGLVLGGVAAMRMASEALGLAREMRQDLATMRSDLKATRETTQGLVADLERMQATAREASTQLAERQKTLQTRLAARAKRTESAMHDLAARRARIPERSPLNPLAKLDAIVDLNRLMADELLILNRHMAQTQLDLAQSLAPLPVQPKGTPGR